jgi:hypothetical protein
MSAALAGAFAGTASAAVAEKSNKKFCKKAATIATDIGTNVDPSDEDAIRSASEDFEKAYKKLAKVAPTKKLKKAANAIADYYGRLADGADPNSSDANYSDDEAEAIQTLTTYVTTKCLASTLDSIPGVDNPSAVDLTPGR